MASQLHTAPSPQAVEQPTPEEQKAALDRAFRATFLDPQNGKPHMTAQPVLTHLGMFCGFMATSITGQPVDAIGMAVIEGRRQMFTQILKRCELDPVRLLS